MTSVFVSRPFLNGDGQSFRANVGRPGSSELEGTAMKCKGMRKTRPAGDARGNTGQDVTGGHVVDDLVLRTVHNSICEWQPLNTFKRHRYAHYTPQHSFRKKKVVDPQHDLWCSNFC